MKSAFTALLLQLLIVCALSGTSASALHNFTYTDFALGDFDTLFATVENAELAGSVVHLVHMRNTKGALWHREPVQIVGSHFTFSFQITQSSETIEGFAFVMHQSDTDLSVLAGATGAGLGYGSSSLIDHTIENSIAIEFDCIQNDPEDGEHPTPHIVVHGGGKNLPNSASEDFAISDYGTTFDTNSFCSGVPTTVNVTLTDTTIVVQLMSLTMPSISQSFDIRSVIDLKSPYSYVGFTSSSSSSAETELFTALSNWTYSYLGSDYAPTSTATGTAFDDITADETGTIIVHAHDQFGNLMDMGGAVVSITHIDPDDASAYLNVTDNGDGTYSSVVTSTLAGTHSLEITLNGAPISGSPYAVTVLPGAIYGPNCRAVGTPPSSSEAGTTSTFNIQGYDRYNNKLTSSDISRDDVSASLAPKKPTDSISVAAVAAGQYEIEFSVETAQEYEIKVTVGGDEIVGSPFAFDGTPGPISPADCEHEDAPSTVIAGMPALFYVVSYDEYGNEVTEGGETVTMVVNPPVSGNTHKISDLGTGRYEIELDYTKTSLTPMQLTVRLNGITVGTPIIVRVEAADVSIPHCVVDEDGRDETTAGVPTVAVLQAMDEYGNKLASEAGKFNATLIGGVNVTGVVSYASGGQYDIAYTALVAGQYKLHVTSSSGTHVKDSPFDTLVTADVAAGNGTIVSSGDFSSVLTDTYVDIVIEARDKHGNIQPEGGDDVSVIATLHQEETVLLTVIEPPVIDNDNGTYSTGFMASSNMTGTYTVDITVNGEHISGSPFTMVIAGPDMTTTYIIIAACSVGGLIIIGIIGFVIYKKKQKRNEYSQLESERAGYFTK